MTTIQQIDLVCINQGDNLEHTTQIAMMGRIYNSADKVVVYLGEETAGSRLVFEELCKVGKILLPSHIKKGRIEGRAKPSLDRAMGPWAGSLDLGTHRNYPGSIRPILLTYTFHMIYFL
jgi:hypothetical protein